MPPTTQIRIRRDTAANFTSANPTLALGEIAYETDTRNIKVGDGATAWTALGYINPYRGGTAAAPTSNTVLGSGAGAAMQAGAEDNVLIGLNAGNNITTADGNVFIGKDVGNQTTGSNSVAIGWEAMASSGSAAFNSVAVGYRSLWQATGGSNVAVGLNAETASGNFSGVTAVGSGAASLNTASDITAVGANALDANTTGTNNTAVGKDALGANTTGTTNIAIGNNAMGNNTTGSSNVVIGWNAGAASTTSLDTAVVIGHQAGATTSVGNTNTLVGGFAGHAQTSFSGASTAVGYAACFSQGGSNAALGASAGYLRADGTIGTGCTSSVFIGQDSRPAGDSQTNQIVIGQGSRGNGSNTTTIGNSSTTATWLAGPMHPGQQTGFGNSGFNLRSTGSNNGIIQGATVTLDVSNDVRIRSNDGLTNRFLVENNGNATISNGNLIIGTSGKGIDFGITTSGTGTMTSELLSDYEEGTFTAEIRFGGASAAMTYTTQNASYTKVGRQVTVRGNLQLSNKGTSTGAATISNLPFTANLTHGSSVGQLDIGNVTFADRVCATIVNNDTQMYLNETTNAGVRTGLSDADFANNSLIFFSLTYFT